MRRSAICSRRSARVSLKPSPQLVQRPGQRRSRRSRRDGGARRCGSRGRPAPGRCRRASRGRGARAPRTRPARAGRRRSGTRRGWGCAPRPASTTAARSASSKAAPGARSSTTTPMRSPIGSRRAAASSGLALAVHLRRASLGAGRCATPAPAARRRPGVVQGRVRPRHPVGAPEGERHGRVVAEADEDGPPPGGDGGVHGVEQQLGTGGRVEAAVEGAGERVQPAQQHGGLAGGRGLVHPAAAAPTPAHGGRPRAQQAAEQGQPTPLQPAGRHAGGRLQVGDRGARAEADRGGRTEVDRGGGQHEEGGQRRP